MSANRPHAGMEQIAEDHQNIYCWLQVIGEQHNIASLEKDFAELIPLLEEHFKLEEEFNKSHTIEDLNVTANVHRLMEISKEHPQLLEGAHKIKGQLAECPAYSQVQQQIVDFVKQLRHHEECETEEFMDAVWTDIGG